MVSLAGFPSTVDPSCFTSAHLRGVSMSQHSAYVCSWQRHMPRYRLAAFFRSSIWSAEFNKIFVSVYCILQTQQIVCLKCVRGSFYYLKKFIICPNKQLICKHSD